MSKSQTVFFSDNPLEADSWEQWQVEDIRVALAERFERMPPTARIYHRQISLDNDVTPVDQGSIDRLAELPGPFYVVVYPGGPAAVIVAVVAVVAAAAVAFMLKPEVPNVAVRNTQNESPNNELSDRLNRPRPKGRIPDIFGTVRSTPDLLSSYRVFQDNEEVEYSFMAVSRGEGVVPANEIRDGDTRILDIAGAAVEVYAPYTSPNSGDAPQLRIGTPINTRVYRADRSNAINGQTLQAPNADGVTGADNIKFISPNRIEMQDGTNLDFTTHFSSGDSVQISSAQFSGFISDTGFYGDATAVFEYPDRIYFPGGVPEAFTSGRQVTVGTASFTYTIGSGALNLNGVYSISGATEEYITLQAPSEVNISWLQLENNFEGSRTIPKDCFFEIQYGEAFLNLAGTYTIIAVTPGSISLASPDTENSDWTLLGGIGGESPYISPILHTIAERWIGPFTLEDADSVVVNCVALNGLYWLTTDGSQRRIDATLRVEVIPVDALDNAIGPAQTLDEVLEGSASSKSTRARTLRLQLNSPGRSQVRMLRVSETPDEEGTIVDEIKWRDLYAMKNVDISDFGNITTVQSVTYATAGALTVKDRKLNMLFTRRVPQWLGGSSFSAPEATNRADHIITAIALDPRIGNRRVQELDLPSIYGAIQEAEEYFGTARAIEFCYTFDNDNMSFEETIASTASAVFCTAYRQGSQIKLKFEKATEDSALLFNHRNKIPGSETRTTSFGNQENYDGVEYEWVTPEDDALITFYLPEDKSAINPNKVESIGVRNYQQAYFHANRIWNKIKYQTTTVDFEATQEAELLIRMDRILVANNLKPGIQDGQVLAQEGLQLKLSQPVVFRDNVDYTIFLQLPDGTVESMPVLSGESARQVTLTRAPRVALITGSEHFAQTLYQVVEATHSYSTDAFLLAERHSQSRMTSSLSAINYDFAYYIREALQIFIFNNIQDHSAFNNSLTATDILEGEVAGVTALGFNGETSRLDLPGLSAPEAYTKSMWVYRDREDIMHLFSSSSTNNEAFLLQASGALRIWHSGANIAVTSQETVPLNSWTHVAATFDPISKAGALYMNGRPVETGELQERPLGQMQIGARINSFNFSGALRDILWYHRCLSASEVQRLYELTR